MVFLNRYDFVYSSRDTVNQVGKIALGLFKNPIMARINQIISQGGKEIERVLQKILRRAIDDFYPTPFRLPGNFEKQQLQN